MRDLLLRFVRDEGGYVAGPEWAFVATILVLGAITGGMLASHADRAEFDPEPAEVSTSR